MLLQVAEFRRKVDANMDGLVSELVAQTGRGGQPEKDAWRSSLSAVRHAFSAASFDKLDMFFGGRGNLALEYRMPGGSGWADMVLLGRHKAQPSGVFIELKNWITRGNTPGIGAGLMERQGGMEQHPSDQVAGYVEWCRNFHSTIQDSKAAVHGCVLFTKDAYYHTYTLPPNDALAAEYPCFSTVADDVDTRLPDFFAGRLTESDREFAEAFAKGGYRQNRSFVSLVGAQILDSSTSPFVLLDGQRKAFRVVKARVEQALKARRPKKTVILVYGPPGSGKSAVAARVWASLVSDPSTARGNIVITTTSASQTSNWRHLFEKVAGNRGASGAVVGATGFSPVTTGDFGKLRKKHPTAFGDASRWRDNLAMLRSFLPDFRSGARDEEFLVSIVDEAHALINPEHVEGRGQFGFASAFGPQAYHAMRCSTVTVFLMDAQQGFRERENTTTKDIQRWSEELGAEHFDTISLEGCQFRCSGSKEYVDRIDNMLGMTKPRVEVDYTVETAQEETLLAAENSEDVEEDIRALKKTISFDVTFCPTPMDMEQRLRTHVSEGAVCRLLASYSREWKTDGAARPHSLPPQLMDFHEPVSISQEKIPWSKIWNFAPGMDYTLFVQAPVGSEMHKDPLCEVGCPYVVRGFDFDYVGLLWLEDLVWRKDRWRVMPEHVHERGVPRLITAAKKEAKPDGPAHQALLATVHQAYRILLTRAIKGLYIWCSDEETQAHLRRALGQS
jgi:hypothetical protein